MGVNAPFPVIPELTGITLAYRNKRLIADAVSPRLDPPLAKQLFKYHVFTKEEGFTIPDTKVGRKSAPNEVEFTAAEKEASTEDHGLDDVVPNEDIVNAEGIYDPVDHAVEMLTGLVLLAREKRVADTTFAAATYPTGNKATLSGTDQWSDVTSKPIIKIGDALDIPLIRPNTMVIGRSAFTSLVRHPDIVKASHANAGDSGIARRQDIAELFELENIYVGEAFYNSAKRGQPAAYARLWGGHCSLLHLNELARNDDGQITFGYTAQWGNRVSGQMPEPKIGLKGSQRVRVGESVKEVISASDLGYLFTDAV